jgi:hypothetical protein
MADQDNLTRRDIIQIAAAAAVTARTVVAAKFSPKFFTKDEFALLDELTELIIPTDDHSPGARAAQVAAYIDARMAESVEEEPKKIWRDGLARIDALSRDMHGHAFMQASAEQRIALLTRISKNEPNPKTPEEHFFVTLKSSTAGAYYTSKVGIHQDMEYKGNVPIKEFVGYELS